MLGPRDPEGYYVVLLNKHCKSRIRIEVGDKLEEVGGYLVYKTKSRSRALRLLKKRECIAKP